MSRSELQRYSDFSPTQFDPSGLGLDNRQDWLVAPVSQTRDSEALSRSNFRVVLADLGGESDDVEVHRFGHGGPGWFEIIIVRPDTEAATKAEQWADALSDYPVASDEDYSQEESEECDQNWVNWLCHIVERAIENGSPDHDPIDDAEAACAFCFPHTAQRTTYDLRDAFQQALDHVGGDWTSESVYRQSEAIAVLVPSLIRLYRRKRIASLVAGHRKRRHKRQAEKARSFHMGPGRESW